MPVKAEIFKYPIIRKNTGFQKIEDGNLPVDLTFHNRQLITQEESLKEQIEGLKIMIFMTSHRVRQPIAHILGISNLVGQYKNSPEDLNKLMGYLKESAQSLETFTTELINYMVSLEEKLNNPGGKVQ